MDQQIHISARDVQTGEDDRFHRFGLIGWWDQTKLAAAKILVVGAGALGNEIVKNLALLGIGNVLIADLDRVENSNLSRSVLFRASDNGRFKADVAVEAARNIYPDIRAHSFVGNVVHDLGLGVFAWADVVIGGLDNREARLAINRACQRVNRPWIDGAIETIQGAARVFLPGDQPCYECTMSKTDWQLLQNRRSCNLLTRAQMQEGRTPTTPTIASIIAGVQCQEAVKLIHGMETIAGKGFVFAGLTGDSYLVDYQRKADCLSHEHIDQVIPLEAGSDEMTAGDLLREARNLLGPLASLELSRDVLRSLDCPQCGISEPMFVSLGRVHASQAACPHCAAARREVHTFFRVHDDPTLLDRPLSKLGIPAWDIVLARAGQHGRTIGFEMAGDRGKVLGPLASQSEALVWE